jgi:hypothetical protein
MGPIFESTRGEPGQASVEFVAVLPVLAVCLVIAAQTVVVGWALWCAGNAARAGARADEVGSNAEAAARRALPSSLRKDAAVSSEDGVKVKVRVPALLPGISLPSVTAASTLDSDGGA